MTGRVTVRTLARLLVQLLLLYAPGCDNGTCPPDDAFVVVEQGTCAAPGTPFTLANQGCHVSVQDRNGASGLPARGAMSQNPQPLRQGDFILYTDDPAPFRLCRATRVEYRLELTCLDAQGAPACNATLTEPSP